jgi:hypothetical protein
MSQDYYTLKRLVDSDYHIPCTAVVFLKDKGSHYSDSELCHRIFMLAEKRGDFYAFNSLGSHSTVFHKDEIDFIEFCVYHQIEFIYYEETEQ